ncbi:MAG: NAD(P)H-hydrate dehydratase [Anaerohalosphaeraceae bacterium]|nr:NAD(P)H-hydrate dehydratase [Anaerohalosphaeraceae bacterium]
MKNSVRITDLPELITRPADGHKGDFGKICIVAGSTGFSGAAAIAARAALRSGAGLVRVALPKSILPFVASLEPCFTTLPLPEDSDGKINAKAAGHLLKAADDNDVLAFGPGVGVSLGVKQVLQNLLSLENLRLVIDADGLNNLAKLSGWQSSCKASVILTPHPGEMKRLWHSMLREQMPTDRTACAAMLAEKAGAVVVLKGSETVISDGEKFYVNTTGNPGMATAGAGDVLTGIITALCGQGLNNFDASVLGVYVHGLAGDLAAEIKGQTSLIATDIIDYLPEAFGKLEHKE